MNFIKPFAQKIILATVVLGIVFSSFTVAPRKAEAVAVPTNCFLLDFYCVMDNLKEFTLNKLAVMVANQLLQRMTASVVNWINKGFDGSPLFLTDPGSFFLDVADQVTGEMLAESGELSRLCAPFSFDIRINLAINQMDSFSTRYDCTLSKIIANTRNAVDTAGQNSGITITSAQNGVSLGNFIDGDFSAGGYPGLLSYAIEPQNNPIGASLLARSDLQRRIAERKSTVDADLDRGQGFLSWQKCTDVTEGYTSGYLGNDAFGLSKDQASQLRQTGNQAVQTGTNRFGNSTSLRKKVSRDQAGVNQVNYEQCRTETPGSIIGGSLQRQLNVPTDKLVLVKTISDSIDAMLGALVNQMLTQGLAALSDSGSAVGSNSGSYLTQLSNESYNADSATSQSSRVRATNTSSALVNVAEAAEAAYQKSVDLLTKAKRDHENASICFQNKLQSYSNLRPAQRSFAEGQIARINLYITNNIDPLISSTTIKKLQVRRNLEQYTDAVGSASGGTVPQVNQSEIDIAFLKLENVIQSASATGQSGINGTANAEQIYQQTVATVAPFTQSAEAFVNSCAEFPFTNNR